MSNLPSLAMQTKALEALLRAHIRVLMSQGMDERDVASLDVVKQAQKAISEARGEE
jgi:hypothetical protein